MNKDFEQLDLVKMFYNQDIDFKTLNKALEKRKETAKSFANYSLEPFAGTFDAVKKRHLLNRSLVGYAKRHMDDLDGLTLQQSIDLLFTEETLDEPTNLYYHELSPEEFYERYGLEDVAPNEPFINRITNDEVNGCFERDISMWSIIYNGMYNQNTSIHWKLFLFLHNLVPVPWVGEGAKGMYEYTKIAFDTPFGSYKDFIHKITLQGNMFIYLNLYLSRKETPDENFAREIQELFTQGKRPTSQFTEEDVRGIARALVGWTFDSDDTRNSTSYETVPVFHPWNHDTSDKHFSSYYNNRIIRGRSGPEGAEELDEVIDMLFETEGSAKYIVRRLYQFFVYPVISDEIESQIIEPLAQVYRDNNFSLVEPLKILLASEHFYSEEIPNSIIKSPIDFLIGVMKEVSISNGNLYYWDGTQHYYSSFNPEVFDDKEKDPSYQKYYLTLRLFEEGKKTGMRFFFPPSVSGWPAYYQAPVYDLFWINSTTSPRRSRFLESFFWGVWINIRKGVDDENVLLKVDFAAYLNSFENPYDVDDVLSEMISRFISITISSETRERLRNTLLGGNSATHWNDDIANLLSDNPTINDYHNMGNRIWNTLYQLGTLGEFQLH